MVSLRDEMPQTAAWIDEIRAVFCTTPESMASFNRQIKAGMDGQQGMFYACENGHEVGRKDTRPGVTPTLPHKSPPSPDLAGTNKRHAK
jgi:hypothetical protein